MRNFYVTLCFLFFTLLANAQTATIWLGGSTDWNDSSNWSDGIPTTGYLATIPASPPDGPNFPIYDGAPLIDFTIQIFGGQVTFDAVVYNTGTLVNSGGGTIVNNQIFVNAGMVQFNNNDGTFTNNGVVDNYGTFTNAGTSTLTNSVGKDFNNFGQIENFGLITNDGNFLNTGEIISTSNIQNNGSIINKGMMDSAFGSTFGISSSASLENHAGAIFEINGTFTNAGSVTNDGSFFIQSASATTNSGSITSNSQFELSGNLDNTGTFVNGSTMLINDSGVFENNNVFTNTGTITLTICGQIIQNAGNNIAGTILNDGIIYEINGTVDVTSNLDFGSEFTDLSQKKAPDTKCRSGIGVFLDENGNGTLDVNAIDKNSFGFCGAALVTRELSQSTFTTADIGVQEIVLTITDEFGFSSFCSGFINVFPYTAPVTPISDPDIDLTCPTDITVQVQPGAFSTIVTWDDPIPTTNCVGNSTPNTSDLVCTTRTISQTTQCSSGEVYSMWLNFDGLNNHYQISNGVFTEYVDGTATITGLATNVDDANVRFNVNSVLSGRTIIAPSGSPKDHYCANPSSMSDFSYYTGCTGTLTGEGSADGSLITISRIGEAFQVGTGANATDGTYQLGASGWFDLTIVHQPSGSLVITPTGNTIQDGDFNLMLSGNVETCGNTGTTACPSTSNSLSGYNYLGEYNGSKYFLSTTTANYGNANTAAINTGGHLATISDESENEFIRGQLSSGSSIWIGFTDEVTEGTWEWLTGEPVSYINWNPGEPNEGTSANNARMRQDNGRWTDRVASNQYYYVVEFDCAEAGCHLVSENINGFTFMGEYNNAKYYVSNSASNWSDANTSTQNSGGNLVVIENQAENDFVQANINPASGSVWTGFNNVNNGFTFQWINGDPVGYTNWASGEPNGAANNHAARLRKVQGDWTDRNISDLYEYVMEIPCGTGGTGGNGLTIQQISGGISGNEFPVGESEVAYEVTDNCGNQEICIFNIIVEANPAEITISDCPVDITVDTEPGGSSAMATWTAPTATSNCYLGSLTEVNQTSGPLSGSILPVGTESVTYTVEDSCGNFSACTFNITVNPLPTVFSLGTCPLDISVQAPVGQTSGVVTWDLPTATSDCFTGGINVDQLVGPLSGDAFPFGVTTIAYVLSDDCGNSALCTFNVTVSESCPVAGTPCDDGDPSTTNDVEDGNCNCTGTPCPVAGTSCDDGDPSTTNDVEDGNCNCTGTPCPVAGTSCDDGDPSTTNDVEDGNCNCTGTPCPVAGTSCDDGDPSTTNDVEDGNCNCAGTPIVVCNVVPGVIELAGGTTDTVICVDGISDALAVNNSTTPSGTNIGWVITDQANNILGLPTSPPFDLDGAGTGTCLIWQIVFEPGLTGAVVGNNVSDLDGCYDLSNAITVIREAADGGTVSLLNGNTTYTGTVGNISIEVQHTTSAPNLSYFYVITDENDNILAAVNSATTNTLDFSNAPVGECHVWGWSYSGEPDPVVGDPITSLEDGSCESISTNFITVIREAGCPAAGTPCDDNDPTTTNDVEDGNCNCTGTPCPVAGTVCDDGDANTENDVEDGECNCAGTPINTGGCTSTTNLALDGTATESSSQFNATGSRAIDGNTDGDFWAGNSVALTNWEAQPWIEIDLGVVANIEQINVYNREDCCESFLSDYHILISAAPFTSTDLAATIAQSGVDDYFESTPAGLPTSITTNSTGRYVRIQLEGTSFLGLAELEIIGCVNGGGCAPAGTACNDNDPTTTNDVEDGNCNCVGTPCPVVGTACNDNNANTENDVEDGMCNCAGTPINTGGCTTTTNLALAGTATESSAQFNATGSRAIDGNTDGDFWAGNSVALTNWETQPWVEVDLGVIANIEQINVYNREDCCQGFLKNYHILISETPFTSTDLTATIAQSGVDDYYETAAAGTPTAIATTSSGRYVRIQLEGTSFLGIAELEIIGCVGGGSCPAAGTPCDDGDPNTTDDVEDGNCNCAGTPIPCPAAGTPCDDGDANTIDDVEDGNCNCAGTPIACPAAGTPCDDGDATTENDVEDGNCNCAGTPINTGGCTSTSNLALAGTATQSSTISVNGITGLPEKAIDGNTNGVFFTTPASASSVSATTFENQPWWQVDLGASYLIEEVNVFNREDGTDKTNNAYILVSNTPITASDLATARSQADFELFVPGNLGYPSVALPNIEGQYVRVQMEGAGYLVLAEVEVYGCTAAVPYAVPNMLNFNAQKKGRTTNVEWVMLKDVNVEYYEVEVSTDGNDFRILDVMEAQRIASAKQYNIIDTEPANGFNFYRLRIHNLDGTAYYSSTRRVNFDVDFGEVIVYPNPTDKYINISLRDFSGKSGTVQIYNHLGQKVSERNYEVIPTVPATFDVSDFIGGIYTVRIKVDEHKAFTKKFIVISKQ